MALPELSVRRPVAVLMATLAVGVFGLLAIERIPVELLPDLNYPTLTVQTRYPDAAPVSVEQFVTRPIEEAVGVIQGVREMRSTSRAGVSEVILEFAWDQPMDFVALDVREKLGLVELPREADLPRVLRYDPSLEPIVRIALSGARTLDDLRELADRWIKPRLEGVAGVAAVKVRGGLDPEIQIEVDEDKLFALGLTLDDVAAALRAENVNRPGGRLEDFGSVYLVRTVHEFDDLREIERTVVREDARGRVRVEDIGVVRRGHVDRVEISRHDGREVVELALHKEGSANTIRVAGAIREALETLDGELAKGLTLTVLSDQSGYIGQSIRLVWSAAAIGGLLAVLVLFFFLRDLPTTGIVALTIPVSVVATFLPLHQAGVTLNIMSLGGLALGVGMLVDNSIVVLEAIDRWRRQGLSRAEAAARGAREVSGAVTAATLTTVSVFLPIVFVQGVAGQLFYDLAVTVCLSLTASLLVSLTLIPSLAALDPAGAAQRGGLVRSADGRPAEPFTFRLAGLELPPVGRGVGWFSKTVTVLLFAPRLVLLLIVLAVGSAWWALSWLFHGITWPLSALLTAIGRGYPRMLRGALRSRWAVLPLAFALFVVALAAVPLLGTDLVPDLAQGEFAFQLRLPEGTPLDGSAQIVERIESALLDDPAFERVFAMVGSLPSTASGRRNLGENLAQIDFVLAPAVAESDAVDRVRRVLAGFPNLDAELVRPSVLSVRAPVSVEIYADDLDLLDQAAATLAAVLAGVDGIEDVATTSEPGNPEIRVILDRDRAGALGVSAERVAASMRGQIRGELVGQFREGEERLAIRLRVAEEARSRANAVQGLRIKLDDGALVPVSAVAQVDVGRGPAAIHRANGARMARLTARASATDLGAALERVQQAIDRTSLPPVVSAELSGQQEEIEVSFASLRLALMLAVFLVYVVMAMQFESLVHPFVILLAVPLGIVGIVAALLLTGKSISVLVLIGTVMLAGIVVNNAIVLVDAINRRRREGQELDEAIRAAGRERLRPILMTTATTVLGLLPMALGLGAGDELRSPLAVTVIGGLTASTLLTLIVVPCIYRVLARGQRQATPARDRMGAVLEGEATP